MCELCVGLTEIRVRLEKKHGILTDEVRGIKQYWEARTNFQKNQKKGLGNEK
jgi:hypothetical protein